MSTEIVIKESFTAEEVRKYIAPKATEKEFAMLMQLISARHLNPFLGEVHFVKFGDSPAQIIVGKDAVLKRAKAVPGYRGFRSGWYDTEGKRLEFPVGKIVGAWCEVYAADREPCFCAVALSEYSTGKSNWQSKPYTMIRKVAIVQAHREFSPEETAGMYEQEEMGVEVQPPKDITPPPAQPKQKSNPIAKRIGDQLKGYFQDKTVMQGFLAIVLGHEVATLHDLTEADEREITLYLQLVSAANTGGIQMALENVKILPDAKKASAIIDFLFPPMQTPDGSVSFE